MDLFDQSIDNACLKPLAERMRPQTLKDFVGQEDIVGTGKLLRRAIEADRLTSVIFYGPPGSGKSTLAHIISNMTNAEYLKINAVTAGINEIKKLITEAENNLKYYRRRTIFFIDEIHSLKRGPQQDILLESVEKGIVILIGATTENPFFHLKGPLLSRSIIFQFSQLQDRHIKNIIYNALKDEERGLGTYKIELEDEALDHIVNMSNGDARCALTALELAVLTTPPSEDGIIHISLDIAEQSVQKKRVNYDNSGDNHYDVISAFIKSIRGSDPDAALYWYARMTYAGEDQRFIVRRLIIHASEDIGMADPNAMLIAHAAWNALECVGMPEARIPIAQAIIYLSMAPKSNSVIRAIDGAMEDVSKNKSYPVPNHLKDTHYTGAAALGNSGYKYPHDYPNHYVKQQYMPKTLENRKYYYPSDQGREKRYKSKG
jgi:putative ATPase